MLNRNKTETKEFSNSQQTQSMEISRNYSNAGGSQAIAGQFAGSISDYIQAGIQIQYLDESQPVFFYNGVQISRKSADRLAEKSSAKK